MEISRRAIILFILHSNYLRTPPVPTTSFSESCLCISSSADKTEREMMIIIKSLPSQSIYLFKYFLIARIIDTGIWYVELIKLESLAVQLMSFNRYGALLCRLYSLDAWKLLTKHVRCCLNLHSRMYEIELSLPETPLKLSLSRELAKQAAKYTNE